MSIDTENLPFGSRTRLRATFEAGLRRMLETESLGAFILVLANASFDADMLGRLRSDLRKAFRRWCAAADSGSAGYRQSATDDLAVFEKLRAIDLDHLEPTRWRRTGPWELQFNRLRALRPSRMSGARVDTLRRPFDPQGFHFDKPFLRAEILWEGGLHGVPVRLLYNKFPFAEMHGLLVPDPAAGKPQYLTAADHELIWAICAELAPALPGIGFGYNAYGAYASVNHLHFQLFERSEGDYPIESPDWRHNGGEWAYPADVVRLADRTEAWNAIDTRQRGNRGFNLVYRPGRLYLVERRLQGHYRHSDWTGGFAWSELAGAVTLSDEARFERLAASDVEAELGRLRVRL